MRLKRLLNKLPPRVIVDDSIYKLSITKDRYNKYLWWVVEYIDTKSSDNRLYTGANKKLYKAIKISEQALNIYYWEPNGNKNKVGFIKTI